jgi:tetratricopeptide (TPR) repeat protein
MKSELSRLYNWQGRVDMGYQISQEALRIAEESGDIYSKTWAYCFHGRSCFYRGHFREARDFLSKGADFCGKINFLKVSEQTHRVLGFVYSEIGKYQISKAHYSKAISIGELAGTAPSEIKFCKTAIANAKVMNTERDIDLELLYGYATENKLKLYEGWMLRNIAEILLNLDGQHLDDAAGWIEKANEADKRNGLIWHLGKDYALFAELLKQRGDQPKAKKMLNMAINIFKECGADGWAEKYEKAMAEL